MAENSYNWYERRVKPSWSPPRQAFPIAWSILYPIIITVNIFVVIKLVRSDINFLTALPFWLNIIFNVAFTPIAPLKRLWLAVADVILVFLTALWAAIAILSNNKWLAIAYIPYILWTLFASVLQTSIALKN